MDGNAPIVWYARGLGGVVKALSAVSAEGAIFGPGALDLLKAAAADLAQLLREQEERQR